MEFPLFLVLHIEWLVWKASNNQSLDPLGNFHHMLPVYQDQWLLICFQCEPFSIQKVVEIFHAPDCS